MNKIKTVIPRGMGLPLFIALVTNTIVYNGSRLVTAGWHHYDVTGRLDGLIPFVPWTIAIYLGCYVFWVVNYVIGCRQNREGAYRFISADFLAKIVCLVCFLVFPTTNVRPVIMGHSFWDEAMRFLYQMDAADNLFPSIHCLTSWFCFIAVRSNKRIPEWYRIVSLVTAILICASTLTTKQHIVIDVIAGVFLAEVCFWVTGRTPFAGYYAKVVEKMAECFGGKVGEQSGE